MAVWKFEDDASLGAEVGDGGIDIGGIFWVEHLAELRVRLELLEAMVGDFQPVGLIVAIVKFIEIAGECGGDSGLADDAWRLDGDAILAAPAFDADVRLSVRLIEAALEQPFAEDFIDWGM